MQVAEFHVAHNWAGAPIYLECCLDMYEDIKSHCKVNLVHLILSGPNKSPVKMSEIRGGAG